MENKFIELNIINNNTPELDSVLWLRSDQVLRILRPTKKDIQSRREIAALVFISGQGVECWAVRETPQQILSMLEEKSFE